MPTARDVHEGAPEDRNPNVIPEDFDWGELLPKPLPPVHRPYTDLSESERRELIRKLENTATTNPTDREQAAAAFDSLQTDEASTQRLAELKQQFTSELQHTLEHDPIMKRAVNGWRELNHDEKVEVLSKVTTIQEKVYDIQLGRHSYYHDPRPEAPLGTAGAMGVGINLDGENFGRIVSTLAHENEHMFQQNLAGQLDTMPADHPLRSAAEIFHLNFNIQRPASTPGMNDGVFHDHEPIERDSHDWGGITRDLVKTTLPGTLQETFRDKNVRFSGYTTGDEPRAIINVPEDFPLSQLERIGVRDTSGVRVINNPNGTSALHIPTSALPTDLQPKNPHLWAVGTLNQALDEKLGAGKVAGYTETHVAINVPADFPASRLAEIGVQNPENIRYTNGPNGTHNLQVPLENLPNNMRPTIHEPVRPIQQQGETVVIDAGAVTVDPDATVRIRPGETSPDGSFRAPPVTDAQRETQEQQRLAQQAQQQQGGKPENGTPQQQQPPQLLDTATAERLPMQAAQQGSSAATLATPPQPVPSGTAAPVQPASQTLAAASNSTGPTVATTPPPALPEPSVTTATKTAAVTTAVAAGAAALTTENPAPVDHDPTSSRVALKPGQTSPDGSFTAPPAQAAAASPDPNQRVVVTPDKAAAAGLPTTSPAGAQPGGQTSATPPSAPETAPTTPHSTTVEPTAPAEGARIPGRTVGAGRLGGVIGLAMAGHSIMEGNGEKGPSDGLTTAGQITNAGTAGAGVVQSGASLAGSLVTDGSRAAGALGAAETVAGRAGVVGAVAVGAITTVHGIATGNKDEVGAGIGGTAGAIAGAEAGGLGGAAAGAALGSIVPIVGTAAGAVVGGAVGSIGGAIVGGMAGTAAGQYVARNSEAIGHAAVETAHAVSDAALAASDKVTSVASSAYHRALAAINGDPTIATAKASVKGGQEVASNSAKPPSATPAPAQPDMGISAAYMM